MVFSGVEVGGFAGSADCGTVDVVVPTQRRGDRARSWGAISMHGIATMTGDRTSRFEIAAIRQGRRTRPAEPACPRAARCSMSSRRARPRARPGRRWRAGRTRPHWLRSATKTTASRWGQGLNGGRHGPSRGRSAMTGPGAGRSHRSRLAHGPVAGYRKRGNRRGGRPPPPLSCGRIRHGRACRLELAPRPGQGGVDEPGLALEGAVLEEVGAFGSVRPWRWSKMSLTRTEARSLPS